MHLQFPTVNFSKNNLLYVEKCWNLLRSEALKLPKLIHLVTAELLSFQFLKEQMARKKAAGCRIPGRGLTAV